MEHQGKLFGLPFWTGAAVLGAAAIVAYVLFFRRRAAADTTPTGFSAQGLAVMQNPDESATMALQNQELSLLGQQFGEFGTHLGEIGNTVDTGFSSVGTSLNSIQGQLTSNANADQANYRSIADQLTSASGASQAYYNSLLASLTTYANNLAAQVQGVSQQEAQDAAAQASGFSSFQAMLDAERQQLSGLAGGISQISQQIIPAGFGTGYFVGTDHRIHIGSYQGTGQPGYGSSQGLMADPSWAIGSTASDPNVLLGSRSLYG